MKTSTTVIANQFGEINLDNNLRILQFPSLLVPYIYSQAIFLLFVFLFLRKVIFFNSLYKTGSISYFF